MEASRATEVNTSNGMGAAGHFLLSTSTVTGKVFKREIAAIAVLSGSVTVVSAKQAINDIENAADYPDWSNEVLDVGVHIVNFRECELSGATMAIAYYGV